MVGHPLDTIKTKMQAQRGFERTTMVGTLSKTLRTQGLIGLYRFASYSGCLLSLSPDSLLSLFPVHMYTLGPSYKIVNGYLEP